MDFAQQSLAKNCEALGIPLELISLKRTEEGWWIEEQVFKKPEQTVLQLFMNDGWQGTRTEGSPIVMAIKCAGFDWMVKHNYFQRREDAIRDTPLGAMSRHADKLERLYSEIESCSEKKFLKTFDEIYSDGIVKSLSERTACF